MIGRDEKDQIEFFYAFNLEDHVPKDHLLRGIDRFLDLSDLHEHLASYYSHTGRPSIDPELMMRMLIVGYCFGIRSERRLCEEVKLNLAYRWFCRLAWSSRSRRGGASVAGAVPARVRVCPVGSSLWCSRASGAPYLSAFTIRTRGALGGLESEVEDRLHHQRAIVFGPVVGPVPEDELGFAHAPILLRHGWLPRVGNATTPLLVVTLPSELQTIPLALSQKSLLDYCSIR